MNRKSTVQSGWWKYLCYCMSGQLTTNNKIDSKQRPQLLERCSFFHSSPHATFFLLLFKIINGKKYTNSWTIIQYVQYSIYKRGWNISMFVSTANKADNLVS